MRSAQPYQVARGLLRRTDLRRVHVAKARMWTERRALTLLGKRRRHPGGRILTYHAVGTPAWGFNDMSPKRFRRQLELAIERGYRFVHPDAIAHGYGQERDLAITFDDGCLSVLTNAAPILKELRIPYTVFVVSGWSDGEGEFAREGLIANWRQVEELAREGATIGSHSVTHPNFGTIEAGVALEELGKSREMIWNRIGINADTFAIPYGQRRDWTAEAAAGARSVGYSLVYAQAEQTRFPGTVPRTKLAWSDSDVIFQAALEGAFDRWEEWY